MTLLLFIPSKRLKKMTAKDWSHLAKKEGWSNEQLGKQIIYAGKQLDETSNGN